MIQPHELATKLIAELKFDIDHANGIYAGSKTATLEAARWLIHWQQERIEVLEMELKRWTPDEFQEMDSIDADTPANDMVGHLED